VKVAQGHEVVEGAAGKDRLQQGANFFFALFSFLMYR
jgi:hypothetical protein